MTVELFDEEEVESFCREAEHTQLYTLIRVLDREGLDSFVQAFFDLCNEHSIDTSYIKVKP